MKDIDVANGALDRLFASDAPHGDQAERYERLLDSAFVFAELVIGSCPESDERTLAVRHIQQAAMFANASIAINEPDGAVVRTG